MLYPALLPLMRTPLLPAVDSTDAPADLNGLVRFGEGASGGIVVKVLRYKPAGRGFDSRCCQWNFSVTYFFRSHYGPGVDSASNRNEYQVYFLGVKAADAWGWQPYHHPVPLSWNLGTLTSWNLLGHSRPVTGLLLPFRRKMKSGFCACAIVFQLASTYFACDVGC